ncbi:selenium metabolism-associated LysR family transcriptional regulator [Tissierella creatinophila]|uniref:HTH-type transcriptional activator CmpR n=1 Tax=Tissierella creatinophila DSM 6911 TaxID=1123403 RepID=A0A1U7M631_TISCR|nr:selenium metabolism-associated LysR family transcriptional regulator [Tissierella creatinophila]OLS02784.1 HTH-type transcriptional activator CmpR [Tissierella creatinophila DSM 6911]
MEFKQVECFVAVARENSFSKAADVLFLSQPAITSNIQKLERELGMVLFDRNKNITLTKGGVKFFPYAVEILNIRDKAEIAISQHKNNIEGVLEICASTIPEQYLLPHIIKAFKEVYPQVHFSIRHKDSKEVIEGILSGMTNFGFIGAKYSHEGIKYIDFFQDKLVLITSPEKTFATDPISIQSLIGEEIVLREEGSGTRQLIENALKEKKLNLNIFRSQTINYSMEAIKKMVALNVGISFASDVSVKCEVASGRLKQYEVEDLNLNRAFSLVYCNNRYLSPAEEKFKEFVAKWKWDNIDI